MDLFCNKKTRQVDSIHLALPAIFPKRITLWQALGANIPAVTCYQVRTQAGAGR